MPRSPPDRGRSVAKRLSWDVREVSAHRSISPRSASSASDDGALAFDDELLAPGRGSLSRPSGYTVDSAGARAHRERRLAATAFDALARGTRARRVAWELFEARQDSLPPVPAEVDDAAGTERSQEQPEWMDTWGSAEEQVQERARQSAYDDERAYDAAAADRHAAAIISAAEEFAEDAAELADGVGVENGGDDGPPEVVGVWEARGVLADEAERMRALRPASPSRRNGKRSPSANTPWVKMSGGGSALYYDVEERELSLSSPLQGVRRVNTHELPVIEHFELTRHPDGRIVGVGFEASGSAEESAGQGGSGGCFRFVNVEVNPLLPSAEGEPAPWELCMEQVRSQTPRAVRFGGQRHRHQRRGKGGSESAGACAHADTHAVCAAAGV